MTVVVPAQYVAEVKRAASGTGLPYQVCACQAYVESGFNPNAVSPTNAQGFWQFEPGTFKSYGKGSPFNVHDETSAYINFMRSLLHEFNGNIRNALAAYNAGPGNVPAGLPYADEILRMAGSSQAIVTQTNTTSVVVNTAPVPTPTADDPSWWINRSGQWLKDVAGTANFYANAIGRL
jgi:soluble lytic murein transglycosylase-like protein